MHSLAKARRTDFATHRPRLVGQTINFRLMAALAYGRIVSNADITESF